MNLGEIYNEYLDAMRRAHRALEFETETKLRHQQAANQEAKGNIINT